MAVGYDGSIRINTKIDNAGAESGLKTLSGSLKRFAATVGAAFAVTAVVSFGKSCIDLASDLNEVKNVVDVTFGSGASKIYDFAKTAATSFGLSELAAKQYTGTMGAMLKSMGFATDSAADMSIEMASLAGDMASFYNLSTDEAFDKIRSGISGETEPLKQLGVNLSEANLSAYALAEGMGVVYSKMTEQNKALVRYNYLMSVTADAQGDFARTSTSWANQVRVLALNWDSLKATLGTSFIAILTPVLKMINSILSSLNAAATVFATFISAITGTAQTATTAVAGTTAATEALTDATDASADSTTAAGAAAKKAGKSFADFDKLNVLSDTSAAVATPADTTTTTTAATDAGKAVDKSIEDMKANLADFFSKYQDGIKRVKEQWEALKLTTSGVFSAIAKQFAGVDIGGATFKTALDFLYAIEAAANLVMGAVGKLFVALNVPAVIQGALDLLAAAFKAIGDAIVAITPGVMTFINTALVPIAEWIGGKVVDAFKFLAEQLTKIGEWFTAHKEDFTALGAALGRIAEQIWGVLEPILNGAWSVFKVLLGGIVDAFLSLGGWVLNHPNLIVDFLAVFTAFKAAAFVGEMAKVIKEVYSLIKVVGIWDGVCFAAAILMDSLKWKTILVAGAFAALVAIIAEVVQKWPDMSPVQKATTVFGLLALAIGGVCIALGMLSPLSVAAMAVGAVAVGTAIVTTQSKISDSMTIPKLAKGAVIPPNREFIATLGDQKRGVNIEAPLDTIKQGVAEVLAGMDFGGGETVTNNVLKLDGRTIYSNQQRTSRIVGKSLVIGGTT